MKWLRALTLVVTALGVTAFVSSQKDPPGDLPNRIPEAAPYMTAEAHVFPPPYEEYWQTQNHPGQCASCHQKIFDEWNGSMMSNSWRDPVWRAAFLLLSRAVSTNGECGTPTPPDHTPKAAHNPFAVAGRCASTFDLGTSRLTVSRPGSLLDAFCSRCHMPTNYIDNVPLRNVTQSASGIEAAPVDLAFNPTSDNGTGIAFATLDSQFRNTESGKAGIFCAVCHSYVATRETPFHNFDKGADGYAPALAAKPRRDQLPAAEADIFAVADPLKPALGYAVGAGAYRLSPHAIVTGSRVGPLAAGPTPAGDDSNTSSVFGQPVAWQRADLGKHQGFASALYVRAEMCAACHDVTNALPIKNKLGRYVGGFPIERTYTEWLSSRYADRPGNTHFDPAWKRDCQSCHMQQDYGQPGTAQTLYKAGKPLPIPDEPVANEGKPRPKFTHHFVGGNAFVPHLIGKDVDAAGNVAPYPELSAFSFSSADHKSPYSRGYWTHLERKGAYAQQGRLAWDRLRHVLSMNVAVPATSTANRAVPISITVANTGSGHDFPTGFPEGRTAWLAVHAFDLATGKELPIRDAVWKRTSIGVGNLTTEEMTDPNFPGCNWHIPPGSADPYAPQWKAIASLGDGCPTLDLPYAAPLNMVVNRDGLPIDPGGRVIDAASNPRGLPQFRDVNGNGDRFDDSFLRDSRFRPMPHAEATKQIDRYAVEIPPGTAGPVALSAAVYYQSVEAMVAEKFLGNMIDSNDNFVLEPCVLGGLCDGRTPRTEPAVVEGAPPVPMVVRNGVIAIDGAPADRAPPRVTVYPRPGAERVYADAVIKVSFSEPVRSVDGQLTLADASGGTVPAWVDQIGPATYGLFPNRVQLTPGARYTARLARGVCDAAGNCTAGDVSWSFTIATDPEQATGNTAIAAGYSGDWQTSASSPSTHMKKRKQTSKETRHARTRHQ
jgi:hypothetical protein